MGKFQTTHGKYGSPEYNAYHHMRKRCTLRTDPNYKDYGGRGITCSWKTFVDFYRDMGEKPGPGYTIERKDNDGPYCKDNCVWATRLQQGNNTRRNRWLTYQGETRTASQWARHIGLSPNTFLWRLRLGWTIEKTMTTPKLSSRPRGRS